MDNEELLDLINNSCEVATEDVIGDCMAYLYPSAIVFNGFSHNSQNKIFIFYNNPHFEADIRTIVHVFLHNQCTMLHLLTDPIQICSTHNPPQENGMDHENIMDYCDGKKLRKYQWDKIQHP